MSENNNIYDLVINGHVVLPTHITYDASVAVKDGKIAGVFKQRDAIAGRRTVNASNQFILPGAIDAHVHCYSSLAEGFTNAGRSAAAGGVTTIIEMPYDADQLICTEKVFLEKKQRLQEQTVVDMAMLATIKKQDGLQHIAPLAEVGACGFKLSMFNTDSTRFPKIEEGEMFAAFNAIAETGCPVGVHAETDGIVRKYSDQYKEQGDRDPRAHCWSRPKVAESTAVLTALEMAYWSGVRLHLYHCTFPRIFELVDYYRRQGVSVTAETCTHYLTLSEEHMLSLKAKGKINPPLRQADDVQQLWELMARGAIDIVTSDHAPWTIDKKEHPNIFTNASGAPGVETLLPVLYSEGVAKGRLSMLDLAGALSAKPAQIFGLDHCKGRIATGMDADLVIIDPNVRSVLNESSMHSSAGWSPYHNWELQGKITHTFVRGNVVYNGDVVGEPGDGQFIFPKHRRTEERSLI